MLIISNTVTNTLATITNGTNIYLQQQITTTHISNITETLTNTINNIPQLDKVWYQDPTMWAAIATVVSAIIMWRSVEEMKKQHESQHLLNQNQALMDLLKQAQALQKYLRLFPNIKGDYIDSETNDIIFKLGIFTTYNRYVDIWIQEARQLLYEDCIGDSELYHYTIEKYNSFCSNHELDPLDTTTTEFINKLYKMLYSVESMADPSAYGLPDDFLYLNEIIAQEIRYIK